MCKAEGLIVESHWGKFSWIVFLQTAAAVLLSSINPVLGIVMHPNGEPNLSTWTDRPDVNVVGRWSNNASFVVIAPNWAVTTRHQNTSPSTVTINGISYTCTYKTEWTGGPSGNADIRLIRLTKSNGSDADLAHYTRPYEGFDEKGKEVVLGGYGNGRGSAITVFYHGKNYVIGYQWDGLANATQRWCQNKIDGNDIGGTFIEADFDGPGDDPNWMPYEGIIALYDSGGGWFINDGGEWKVAGLSHGVTTGGASIFRDSSDPRVPAPDGMDAVRISTYTQWIKQIILAGDLNDDEWVDFVDFALLANQWMRNDCNAENNWCDGADFLPYNGSVDWDDLNVLAGRWLKGW